MSANIFDSDDSLSSYSENDLLDKILDDILSDKVDIEVEGDDRILYNKDGTICQRNRTDYSRSKKRVKSEKPWHVNRWLQLISHEDISNPSSREGKEFRQKFRTPFPVFIDID
jgi:hypothetical protein